MNWRDHLSRARIEVGPSTREQHIRVIEEALEAQRSRRSRPGRALAVAVALVLLLPVVAFAAERSGPGDVLYPVRQAMERANIRLPDLTARAAEIHQTDDATRPSVTTPGSDPRDTSPTTVDEHRRDSRPTTTTTVPDRTGTTVSRSSTTTTRPPTSTTLPERTPSTRPDS